MNESSSSPVPDGERYVLPTAILVAALIIVAGVYLSVSPLSLQLTGIQNALNANALAVKNAPPPSPSPSPSPSVAPSGPGAAPASDMGRLNLAGLPYQGGAAAKVKVVEFSDFECPFCRSAYPTVSQVLGNYGNQIQFYYLNFPLTSIHPYAEKAAEAYVCARDQDAAKSWQYYGLLFQKGQDDGTGLAVSDLKSYAAQLGLDTSKFNTCLDGGQMASVVAAEQSEGSALGVQGTPTFFINGVQVVGAQPYSAFQSAIDAALAS